MKQEETKRKLHSCELYYVYSSPNIIMMTKSMRMRWAGHVAHMRAKRNACSILVGKPEEKRKLKRPRRRRQNNIIIDLK
jgi:hypothetical protein